MSKHLILWAVVVGSPPKHKPYVLRGLSGELLVFETRKEARAAAKDYQDWRVAKFTS